jgi:gas vesicle protein
VAFACLVLRRRVTNLRKKGATVAIGQDIGAPNGGSATEQAQQKVQDAGRQAQQQAQHAAGQARNRIREQVDQRSTDAGEQISSQASDLRTVADQLREQGKDKPAQLAERAAQYTGRVGSYLKETESDRILSDAEDFHAPAAVGGRCRWGRARTCGVAVYEGVGRGSLSAIDAAAGCGNAGGADGPDRAANGAGRARSDRRSGP